ncbi:MAG: EAL domain-containing protein [Roseiarcus sp.]
MTETSQLPTFRALILEDHDFQRRIGAQVLRRCGGAEVLEARDGAEAVRLIEAQSQPLDVLLCDLNMPGMDGLAFLRHIAERQNESSIILASALDPSILRAAEIMAGSYGLRILGVVEKPLSRTKLVPLVLRHFSQKRGAPKPQVQPMPLEEIAEGVRLRQFEPFFQPKVDIKNCTLVGVEALMRWRHPKQGLVPPAAFISAMEENGLISSVTFALVEASLARCRGWRDIGLDVPVSVNISVESLSDMTLPDRLMSLVRAAGLTPRSLVLEVTETAAMSDLGHALETLARCRMKGFDLSIDDYGTGFSSMQQLTRLPLSELKIDQTFVTGACKQEVLAALIETSVAMARRLKLRTVAEGVETSDDWDVVARLGCDVAQGYFIAKPMPGGEIADWYSAWLGARREATLQRLAPVAQRQ